MRSLSEEALTVHAPPTAEQETYAPGTVIFEENAEGRQAFIVHSGLVEISKTGPHGQTVLGYVGAGEIFGEMSIIDGSPRMATARAIKETSCSVVSEALLQSKLMEADPFVRDILSVLVNGVRSMAKDVLRNARTLEDPPYYAPANLQGQHRSLNV